MVALSKSSNVDKIQNKYSLGRGTTQISEKMCWSGAAESNLEVIYIVADHNGVHL